MSKKPPESHNNHAGGNAPGASRDEDAFRRWLNDQLKKTYDPVLEEDVPDDLLDVLRKRDTPESPKKEP